MQPFSYTTPSWDDARRISVGVDPEYPLSARVTVAKISIGVEEPSLRADVSLPLELVGDILGTDFNEATTRERGIEMGPDDRIALCVMATDDHSEVTMSVFEGSERHDVRMPVSAFYAMRDHYAGLMAEADRRATEIAEEAAQALVGGLPEPANTEPEQPKIPDPAATAASGGERKKGKRKAAEAH